MKSRDYFRIFLYALYFVSFGIIIFFLWDGIRYYLTPYHLRPHSPAYRTLRPAGFRGHGFGIIGSAMMVFMLFYSVRKRFRIFKNWGRLNRWLDIHIYFGIIGPLLVILHTSFKVQGIIAVSFWSMIAVALSGIVGRYLYLQIPRNIKGEELNLQQMDDLSRTISVKLKDEYQMDPEILEKINASLEMSALRTHSIIKSLFYIRRAEKLRKRKIRAVKKQLKKQYNLPRAHLKGIIKILKQKSKLQKKIVILGQVQSLFHYWHVIHKPFAYVMYLIMLVHVGVAVWLGYTWIF